MAAGWQWKARKAAGGESCELRGMSYEPEQPPLRTCNGQPEPELNKVLNGDSPKRIMNWKS